MMDLSSKSVVVLDHSMFMELALRLARDGFGTVYYVDPTWEQARARIDHAITGDGFSEIVRVKEIWDVIEKVDCAVFPDTYHSGMQDIIERKMGVPVWGGRKADNLELNKIGFRKIQEELGMAVPDYQIVHGLEALRDFCKDPENDDHWIKITPQFRGNRETFHHVNYQQSRSILDEIGLDFNIVQDVLTFLCEKTIKADLEGGLDTYTVDGEHPSIAVQGYESKDLCYFAVVQPYAQIPKEITGPSDALWPVLKERRCRQFISSEVKIPEAGREIMLEPTIRLPSPAGEEQMELYGNLPEIIYEGAQGRLVEPEITAHFACEAMVEHKGNKDRFRSIQVPGSVRRWIKLYDTVQIGDTLGIAPGSECIGAVVGIGDTPQEALDHLKENAEAIKDQDVIIHTEALAGILQEIEEAQSQGVKFTDKPMPEPAEAVAE